jgi:hypothetical protein
MATIQTSPEARSTSPATAQTSADLNAVHTLHEKKGEHHEHSDRREDNQ